MENNMKLHVIQYVIANREKPLQVRLISRYHCGIDLTHTNSVVIPLIKQYFKKAFDNSTSLVVS